MLSPEQQIAEILAARDSEGKLLHSERDVATCFAILLKSQSQPPEHLDPQTNVYFTRLMTWAGVKDGDSVEEAARKLDLYFEANPIPSALLSKLSAVLQIDVPQNFSKLLGTDSAFKPPRQGKPASVLGFMLSQRTAAPGDEE